MKKKYLLLLGLFLLSTFSWAEGTDVALQSPSCEKPEWVHGQNRASVRSSLSLKYEGNIFYAENKGQEFGEVEVSFWNKDGQLLYGTSVYIYNKVEIVVPIELMEKVSYLQVSFDGRQYVGVL